MKLYWDIVYMAIAIFAIVLLPFAIFFYESDPDKTIISRFLNAFFMTIAALIISCLIIFISFIWLSVAEIPVQTYTIPYNTPSATPVVTQQTMNISVAPPIYIIGILSFVGWIFFVLFGGVGLTALPLDLILEFKNRPIIRSVNDMKSKKEELKQRTKYLTDMGV